MKSRRATFAVLLLLATPRVRADEPPEAMVQRGQFEEAAAAFMARAAQFERDGRKSKAAGDLLNASSCLKATGDVSVAGALVQRAESLLPADAPPGLLTEMLAQKGAVLALGKRPTTAIPLLEQAAMRARDAGNRPLLADVWNDLGIAESATGNPTSALKRFAAAEESAIALGDGPLAMRCRQNHLIAAHSAWDEARGELERMEETGAWTDPARDALAVAAATFDQSFAASKTLAARSPDSTLAVFHALTAGMAGARFGKVAEGFLLLHAGLEMARRTGDLRLERAALLALSEVYLDERRAAEALELLEHARGIAGEAETTQAAQLELLAALCHHRLAPGSEGTRQALERSIESLHIVRSDIARTQAISDLGRSFRERAGSAYLLLADYHLRAPGPAAPRAARDAVESFKAWELQDFFRDDCVNLALQQQVQLDQIPDPGVAILYVIPLEDRTEVLLGHRGQSHRWTSPLTGKQVATLARRFRFNLESDFGSYRFLDEAEALYDALIRPLQGFLNEQGIRHLVFIPDGPLGAIPLAALFDRQRERYLVEDFSVSISPGLSLTSFEPLAAERSAALLFGADESFLGFPPLPAIKDEMARLGRLYPLHPPRMNREFTAASLADGLRDTPANIIHIACHGEFKGKAGESFLVASDRKIQLDDLEQAIRPKKYLGHPVELLCLSACRTAAGDDRAALGLAGAAVKSGSRSVLATLWYIDDQSASRIMVDFHRRLLAGGGIHKAEALRQAQLAHLREDPIAHPRQWAPFILIGNWK